MQKCACFFLVSFLLAVICAQSYELSLEDLCQLSSDIITATPIASNSYQSENKMHIYTKFKFEVTEKFKGRFNKNDQFEMLVYGGKVNGITKLVAGAPYYSIGEESLLFLNENKSKKIPEVYYTLTGGIQGKFNLSYDEKDKVKKVTRESVPALFSPIDEVETEMIDKIRFDKMISLIKAEISRDHNAK